MRKSVVLPDPFGPRTTHRSRPDLPVGAVEDGGLTVVDAHARQAEGDGVAGVTGAEVRRRRPSPRRVTHRWLL